MNYSRLYKKFWLWVELLLHIAAEVFHSNSKFVWKKHKQNIIKQKTNKIGTAETFFKTLQAKRLVTRKLLCEKNSES